jgi:Fe-S cluster biosynthesis and repair protein YggX
MVKKKMKNINLIIKQQAILININILNIKNNKITYHKKIISKILHPYLFHFKIKDSIMSMLK